MSWWWMVPCAIAILAAPLLWRPLWRIAGSFSMTPTVGDSAIKPASQLGFSATHEGNDWRLVWSRDAITRLNVVGAMLNIRDGGVDRLQFLSPVDLAAGAILYVPKTSDLVFNLKVTLPAGPDVEEQIRVLGQDGSTELTNVPPPRRIGEAARTAPLAQSQAQAPAPVRQFHAPPVPETAKVAPPSDVALPDVRLPHAAAPLALRFTGGAPPLPRLAAPAPAPAAQPPVPQVVTPLTTRVEAAPLRTVVAQWPRGAARQTRVDIKIRVKIDPQGRVIGASPIDRTVANFPFVDSAMAAARLWTFSPATENGHPVASETVLTFKFTP